MLHREVRVRTLEEPHGITSQKTLFFIVTAVKNLKSYIELTSWTLQRRRNVFPVKYELVVYIPEEAILHSHRCENLKSYRAFISQKTTFFIVTTVKTSNFTKYRGFSVHQHACS
jgi:hypothetical protein